MSIPGHFTTDQDDIFTNRYQLFMQTFSDVCDELNIPAHCFKCGNYVEIFSPQCSKCKESFDYQLWNTFVDSVANSNPDLFVSVDIETLFPADLLQYQQDEFLEALDDIRKAPHKPNGPNDCYVCRSSYQYCECDHCYDFAGRLSFLRDRIKNATLQQIKVPDLYNPISTNPCKTCYYSNTGRCPAMQGLFVHIYNDGVPIDDEKVQELVGKLAGTINGCMDFFEEPSVAHMWM